MQHCEECGAELPENALFCGHCGRKTRSDDEITTHENSSSTEDISDSPSDSNMSLSDTYGTTSGSDEEKQQQTPDIPSENETESEEQPSFVTSELEREEQALEPSLEERQDLHLSNSISDFKDEEQSHQQKLEKTSLLQDDVASEPEILENHISQEQPQLASESITKQVIQSPSTPSQKSNSRHNSRCLLYFLSALIVIAGVIVVVMAMFHLNFLGFGRSSQAISNSSYNVIINSSGSSLTASVCVKTSTPSTSASNQGSTFIINSSSGCTTITASKTDSSCLIFPNPTGTSHQFIVDVSNALIDSKSYHLVFSVIEYVGPTTYNDAKHVTVGLSEGSSSRNFSWFYRSGNIAIKNDEQSGTMDVVLGETSGVNTLHIVGDWACGRQMKNT